MKGLVFIPFVFLLACTASDSEENFFAKVFQKSTYTGQSNSSPESLDPGNYVSWIENEENGLRIKKELEGFTFTLQYKPLDYVVLTHFKRGDMGKNEFEKKKEEFEGMQYYTLRIESKSNNNLLKAGIKNPHEEYERLQYFAFNMQNDLQLIEGEDSLKCVLHHFERTYNITPYCDFVIGFDLSGKEKKRKNKFTDNDKILIYNDQVLNLGIIKMKIKKEDLNNTPTLIYNINESKS